MVADRSRGAASSRSYKMKDDFSSFLHEDLNLNIFADLHHFLQPPHTLCMFWFILKRTQHSDTSVPHFFKSPAWLRIIQQGFAILLPTYENNVSNCTPDVQMPYAGKRLALRTMVSLPTTFLLLLRQNRLFTILFSLSDTYSAINM
jgi:hypothetical protein